jgi:hypothetical protein
LLTFFILLFAIGVVAQNTRPVAKPPAPRTPDKITRDDDQDVSLPEDMRIKMAIARAEDEHKKVLEDVEKLSDLSAGIAKAYGERKLLSSDDVKKLGTIEKLAKHVLNHAGGGEVDDKSAATDNTSLADAIEKLNTAAANIRKDMKAETRFVVSASVIANSNEVINLARFIRRTQKAD